MTKSQTKKAIIALLVKHNVHEVPQKTFTWQDIDAAVKVILEKVKSGELTRDSDDVQLVISSAVQKIRTVLFFDDAANEETVNELLKIMPK